SMNFILDKTARGCAVRFAMSTVLCVQPMLAASATGWERPGAVEVALDLFLRLAARADELLAVGRPVGVEVVEVCGLAGQQRRRVAAVGVERIKLPAFDLAVPLG